MGQSDVRAVGLTPIKHALELSGPSSAAGELGWHQKPWSALAKCLPHFGLAELIEQRPSAVLNFCQQAVPAAQPLGRRGSAVQSDVCAIFGAAASSGGGRHCQHGSNYPDEKRHLFNNKVVARRLNKWALSKKT